MGHSFSMAMLVITRLGILTLVSRWRTKAAFAELCHAFSEASNASSIKHDREYLNIPQLLMIFMLKYVEYMLLMFMMILMILMIYGCREFG
jgi:hypothetical protein